MRIQIASGIYSIAETPDMNCPFGPYTHNWLKVCLLVLLL